MWARTSDRNHPTRFGAVRSGHGNVPARIIFHTVGKERFTIRQTSARLSSRSVSSTPGKGVSSRDNDIALLPLLLGAPCNDGILKLKNPTTDGHSQDGAMVD
jgi:hypothetical protein